MSDEKCHVEPVVKPIDEEALAKSITAILAVSGMGCPRCAMRVRNSLLSLDGVVIADVVLEKGLAGIAYDPAGLTSEDLIRAVASAGDGGHHVYHATFVEHMQTAIAFQ